MLMHLYLSTGGLCTSPCTFAMFNKLHTLGKQNKEVQPIVIVENKHQKPIRLII